MSRWNLSYKGLEVVTPEEWNSIVDALNELDSRCPLEINFGVATIESGMSSVDVSHGLSGLPTVVLVTGTHREVKDVYVSNITETTFTVSVDVAVTSDRYVHWLALRR